MLKIRLKRIGRKNTPFFAVVVAEHSVSAKGKIVEQLGHYNPVIKPWSFEADTEKVLAWIKKGAKPSNTVARLLKAAGVKDMDRFIIEMKDRKKKKSAEATAPQAAPAAPAPEKAA